MLSTCERHNYAVLLSPCLCVVRYSVARTTVPTCGSETRSVAVAGELPRCRDSSVSNAHYVIDHFTVLFQSSDDAK